MAHRARPSLASGESFLQERELGAFMLPMRRRMRPSNESTAFFAVPLDALDDEDGGVFRRGVPTLLHAPDLMPGFGGVWGARFLPSQGESGRHAGTH